MVPGLAAGVLSFAGITLSPAVGAILMSVSTVVVAFNAQLLRRLDLRPRQEPEVSVGPSVDDGVPHHEAGVGA